jgi:peptidoglycan/LPS O-acetylase OafA/YrhL
LAQTFYGAFPQLPLLGGGYAMLGALMVFVSVLLNRRLQRLMSGPVFAFLGRISYAMYVSHFLLLGSLSSYLFLTLNSRWNYNTSCAMVWVFSIAVLVAISYCLTIYVDEPVTRIASRLAKMQRLHARENDQSVAEKRSA